MVILFSVLMTSQAIRSSPPIMIVSTRDEEDDMKYEFTFEEVNYGVVSIESDTRPTRDDVIESIKHDDSYVTHTDYKNIKLCGSTRDKSRSVHDPSR